MTKPRAVVVGGKGFNVPKQLHRHFDMVRHYEQDKSNRISGVPDCDIILVIRDYVHHAAVEQIAQLSPGVPIVAARAGWSHLCAALEARKLLPPPEDTETPAIEEVQELPKLETPPIPPEEQISDEDLERLTAPPPKEVVRQNTDMRLLDPAPPDPTPEDRVNTLADLFKATSGELTPEVRDLYMGKFKEAITGPIARAARNRLGLAPRRQEKTAIDRIAENPVVRESLILYGNVEKLVERRNEILAEIERLRMELADVDKDLEIYKPIIQHFELLKSAQIKVKTALEQKALQQRRLAQ